MLCVNSCSGCSVRGGVCLKVCHSCKANLTYDSSLLVDECCRRNKGEIILFFVGICEVCGGVGIFVYFKDISFKISNYFFF